MAKTKKKQKSKANKSKTQAHKPKARPRTGPTFRQFVESKGIVWDSIDGPGRDVVLLGQLQLEFTKLISEPAVA